jgi:hypothetical protein
VTELKPGDRVLALGEVVGLNGDEARVEFTEGSDGAAWVPLSSLQSAPPPPYVEPELVPGMVVAPLDKKSDQSKDWWWVVKDRDELRFMNWLGLKANRPVLPDQIRVVHDPRQVTS